MSASIWRDMPPDPAVLQALDRFGFPPSSVASVNELSGGTGPERSFRVRAVDADWVLKRYPGSTDLGRLERAHRWEERLAEAGFPVAPLHRSWSGSSVVTDRGGHYVMHGWVHGRQWSIADRDGILAQEPRLAGDLGALVGILHRISSEDGRGAQGQAGQGGENAGGGPDRLLTAPRYAVRKLRRPQARPPVLSRWRALRLRRDKSDFDRWIIQVLPDVAARARRLARHSRAYRLGPGDVGLIHHDLNWENLIFDEELHLLALLDFDNATRGAWMIEVGSAAVVLAGTDHDLVEQFLTGYQATSPVPVDRGLVRLAMELKCVQSILNSVLVYLDGDTDTTLREPWCRQLHTSLRELVETDTAGPVPGRLRGSTSGPLVGGVQQEDGSGWTP